ncbi:MAG: hypothetical protein AAGA93_23845 [Actinomycetota bacterium]
MDGLVFAFAPVVAVCVLVLLALLLRLDRRLSRGSLSAGPREPLRAEPPGLLQTPWELQAIDDQLLGLPGDRHRSDLVKTINRLIDAGGITDPAARLPFDARDHEIETVVAELERRLELGPLPPTTGGPGRLGSAPR